MKSLLLSLVVALVFSNSSTAEADYKVALRGVSADGGWELTIGEEVSRFSTFYIVSVKNLSTGEAWARPVLTGSIADGFVNLEEVLDNGNMGPISSNQIAHGRFENVMVYDRFYNLRSVEDGDLIKFESF